MLFRIQMQNNMFIPKYEPSFVSWNDSFVDSPTFTFCICWVGPETIPGFKMFKSSSMQVHISIRLCEGPVSRGVGWGHLADPRSDAGLPVQTAVHLILALRQRKQAQEEQTFNPVVSLRDPHTSIAWWNWARAFGCSWAMLITPAPCVIQTHTWSWSRELFSIRQLSRS